jgi:hypothetical protein
MQNKIDDEYFLRFQMSDIREYEITWKQELFFKNRSTVLTAKCLIKKSIFIGKNKSID